MYFRQGEQDSVSPARSFGEEQEQDTYNRECNKGFEYPLSQTSSPGNNSGHVTFIKETKAEVENSVLLTKSPVEYQKQEEQGCLVTEDTIITYIRSYYRFFTSQTI